ncbi:MAG TPA: M14 family metallopeptidase [Vicinamibacteria bacterium]|nr:M14 family metallopeptidase [Vicinamibacteria bacterium]
MRSVTLLAMTLLAAATASAQSPLTVGSATARPGETASGVIAVPDGADPGAQVPVSVVNGVRPGPVLALVAGTHGYEYTSIVALPRVLAKLDAKKMAGAVILVHMANPPAFYERRIYRNVDGKNLNRVYPGNVSGTQTERIAFALTRDVIDKATHLVDMHCGDGNESLWRYSYWQVTGDAKMDAAGKELALAFGLDHIVIDRERPKDLAHSLYTSNTAVLRGKPAITAESGGMGQTDEESVAAQEKGALSVIAQLGIQEFPSARVAKPLFIDRSEVVASPVTGVWRGTVEKMQTVAEGAILGQVRDPFGKVLAEVKAPFAGKVLYVVGTPPVSKGEPVAFVGHVTEVAP